MRFGIPLATALAVVTLSSAVPPPATAAAAWPALASQLSRDRVQAGSALEGFIAAHQDFSILRAEEAQDTLGIPPWLRVAWRQDHPDGDYSAKDPSGGYPRALREIYEWMLSHQDLLPPKPGTDSGPDKAASVGGNLRASEAVAVPRSESDIRINFLAPTQIIAASNNIGGTGRQRQYFSSDGGLTWGSTELPLTSTDSFHSDPTVDWTSDGKAWSATLGIRGNTLKVRAYVSTNGGATWAIDGTPSGTQKNTDKEMMWIDHSASSSFRDNIYVCWHNGNPAYVARRTAAGWQAATQVSGTESTGTAIGCDIKTNSAGDVFNFWPTTGNQRIVVRKSTTGGASWSTAVVAATTFDSFDIGMPAFNSRRAFIYVSGGAYKTATKNNVYATWTDLSGDTGCTAPANEPAANAASACKTRIWFARSTDGGTTWSAKAKVNNQASKNDQFNQFLAVDEANGRIGLIYYDTVGDAARLKTDLYYQSSADDGVTWSAPLKVTSAMTNETISGADLGNQYGDYNSLSGFLGKFFPSWTDRRSGAKEEVWTAPILDP